MHSKLPQYEALVRQIARLKGYAREKGDSAAAERAFRGAERAREQLSQLWYELTYAEQQRASRKP